MLAWIAENLATIIISLALIGLVAGIIIVIIKDKKKGKSTCGGSCGHCPMGGCCRK